VSTEPRGGRSAGKENQIQGGLRGQGRPRSLEGRQVNGRAGPDLRRAPHPGHPVEEAVARPGFECLPGRQTKAASVDVDDLYKKIGKLEMESDF